MAATFETLSQQTTTFGNNSYLEVARKRLRDDRGEMTDFIVITRGLINERGEKRWTRFLTLPCNDELAVWFAEAVARACPPARSGARRSTRTRAADAGRS